MEVITLVVGGYGVNCYIVIKGQDCLVIDPGDDWPRIDRVIKDKSLNLKAILITHCHFDHIGAMAETDFPDYVPVYAHEEESQAMKDPYKNLSVTLGRHISVAASDFVSDGQSFMIGDMKISVIEIYGHTANSLCYYMEEEGLVFTGDTLFAGSVGRTDFLGASIYELAKEIKDKLLVLDEKVKVYPGHGPATTIGIEAKSNPYVKG